MAQKFREFLTGASSWPSSGEELALVLNGEEGEPRRIVTISVLDNPQDRGSLIFLLSIGDLFKAADTSRMRQLMRLFRLTHAEEKLAGYLARLVADENGRNKYFPCEPDEAMFRDYDGVWNFRLGLAIEGDGTTPYMIHWLIALENVSEEVLTLKIVGAPGTVDIRIGDADSLAAAAQRICEWMIALQSDVSASLGESAPIGFRGQR